jgi:hypothetical protein
LIKHGVAVTTFENNAMSTGVKSTEHHTKRPGDGQANGQPSRRIDIVAKRDYLSAIQRQVGGLGRNFGHR